MKTFLADRLIPHQVAGDKVVECQEITRRTNNLACARGGCHRRWRLELDQTEMNCCCSRAAELFSLPHHSTASQPPALCLAMHWLQLAPRPLVTHLAHETTNHSITQKNTKKDKQMAFPIFSFLFRIENKDEAHCQFATTKLH